MRELSREESLLLDLYLTVHPTADRRRLERLMQVAFLQGKAEGIQVARKHLDEALK